MNLLFLAFCAILVLVKTLILLFSDKKKLYSRIEILRNGIRVPGEIIDLNFFGLFYRFPVVRFKTKNEQYVTFTSSDKVSIGELRKGEEVEVCYLPAAPERFVIVSGFDIMVKSETQATQGAYRLTKGQERRVNTSSKPKKRN
jgi:hypothetical protein